MLRHLLIMAIFALAPTVGAALPLIFVQTTVTLFANETGALEAIGIDWLYDQEFTHLLAHEIGADEDETMRLSEAEISRLRELVLDWPPEFTGDLVVRAGGTDISLLPREMASMTFEFGHIREKYKRSLSQSLSATDTVMIKVFDPFYITAYSIVSELKIEGPLACPSNVIKADMDKAHESASSILGGVQVGDLTGEDIFPPFGEAFADTVVIKCEQF